MKIEIRESEDTIILSDEELDNDNFVIVLMGEKEMDVPLDDLLAAVHAFLNKRG